MKQFYLSILVVILLFVTADSSDCDTEQNVDLEVFLSFEPSCAVSTDVAIPPNPDISLSPTIASAPITTHKPDALSLTKQSSLAFATPFSTLKYVPSVRVSNELGENSIIAEYDERYDTEGTLCAFVITDDTVHDILISRVIENDEGRYIENGGFLYVPELSAGQAVCLFPAYGFGVWRIAYTNSSGEYEAVLLHWDGGGNENELTLTPTEPLLENGFYDEWTFSNEYSDSYSRFTKAFREKVLSGAFDAYVPTGFIISGGSFGDVNNDGIEDALICLMTAGYRVAAYNGVMPLFVLIGQPEGGYVVAQKNPGALFATNRNSSHPVAGNGYIDFVYDYCGGAVLLNTEIYRFWYDPVENDWLLKEFFVQPKFNSDFSGENPQNFVRALPSFFGLSIEGFERDVYWNDTVIIGYFDAIVEGRIADPHWDNSGRIYTLAIKLNEAQSYYEGYLNKYYEFSDSGYFIQTIRGEYSRVADISVIFDEEDLSFIINDDVWKLDEWESNALHIS